MSSNKRSKSRLCMCIIYFDISIFTAILSKTTMSNEYGDYWKLNTILSYSAKDSFDTEMDLNNWMILK